MTAYYNEIDPYAAQWLRNLIEAGHIAAGVVDERSIEDVTPGDLRGFTQCHFFAGIGVWSYALRQSGWSDDRPVWTGSCPCQPFSAAGKGSGFADERHLWPHFHYLIEKCRPETVFGEQVASKDGIAWFDLVQADLEGTGYASAALDICAAGFGAPHIRQRLFWVANAASKRQLGWRTDCKSDGCDTARFKPERLCNVSGMADTSGFNDNQLHQNSDERGRSPNTKQNGVGGIFGGMANTYSIEQRQDAKPGKCNEHEENRRDEDSAAPAGLCFDSSANPVNGFWRDSDWLLCRDGKWRPVEPGTFPLANGAPQRVGRLRAYGNAINAEVAKGFIEAYMEVQNA